MSTTQIQPSYLSDVLENASSDSIIIDSETPKSEYADVEMGFICNESNEDREPMHSPSKSLSLSQSENCRYCYNAIDDNRNLSSCHCNGKICQDCFRKEMILTCNRSKHLNPYCNLFFRSGNNFATASWKFQSKSVSSLRKRCRKQSTPFSKTMSV